MLAQCLGLRDGIVAFLAADTLVKIGAPASAEVVKVLDDPVDETRRRAAELLGKLPPDPTGEPRILEALGKRVEHDKAWIVRGESAGALGARGALQAQKGFAMGVLCRAMTDTDETVATAAAKALGALGEPRAIPRLVDAMENAAAIGRPALVKAIQNTLAQLSKDAKPRDARAWRAWWSEHEAEFTQPLR
jgi:HEAT repeat protein